MVREENELPFVVECEVVGGIRQARVESPAVVGLRILVEAVVLEGRIAGLVSARGGHEEERAIPGDGHCSRRTHVMGTDRRAGFVDELCARGHVRGGEGDIVAEAGEPGRAEVRDVSLRPRVRFRRVGKFGTLCRIK